MRIRERLDLTQQAVGGFNSEAPTIFAEDLGRWPIEVDQHKRQPLVYLSATSEPSAADHIVATSLELGIELGGSG